MNSKTTAQELARKCAIAIPPDVLEHPLPFPARLEYATNVILRELKLDKLLSDKEMLDWVEENHNKVGCPIDVHGNGNSVREVIYAAMKGTND